MIGDDDEGMNKSWTLSFSLCHDAFLSAQYLQLSIVSTLYHHIGRSSLCVILPFIFLS